MRAIGLFGVLLALVSALCVFVRSMLCACVRWHHGYMGVSQSKLHAPPIPELLPPSESDSLAMLVFSKADIAPIVFEYPLSVECWSCMRNIKAYMFDLGASLRHMPCAQREVGTYVSQTAARYRGPAPIPRSRRAIPAYEPE